MIGQLLWKEYRTQRAIIILGLVFLFGPILVYLGIGTSAGFDAVMTDGVFIIAVTISIALSQITFLVLGGSIIATERQNGSLNFQLLLPPTRSHLLLVKSIFCLAVIGAIWTCLLILAEVVLPFCVPDHYVQETDKTIRSLYTVLGAIGLAMFGMAWMGSAVFENVAIPTVLSLTLAVGILVGCSRVPQLFNLSLEFVEEYYWQGVIGINLLIAVSSFIGGWLLFTRRW